MLPYIAWTTTIAVGMFLGNTLVFGFNLLYIRYRDKKDKPLLEAYQKKVNALLDEARAERIGTLVSSGSIKTH